MKISVGPGECSADIFEDNGAVEIFEVHAHVVESFRTRGQTFREMRRETDDSKSRDFWT